MSLRVPSESKKYNRFRCIAQSVRILLGILIFTRCESLEGERLLVPEGHLSVFIPGNWQGNLLHNDATLFEALPRQGRRVKVQILLEPRAAADLDDMQRRALLDVQELARKNGLKITDVTRVKQKRGHIAAMRLIHQLDLGNGAEVTHIADLIPLAGKAVVVTAIGERAGMDELSPEIERILSSVRSLTPEPEASRVLPPDAVTGASQRAAQTLLNSLR
jgi:hypothetical protein